MKSTALAIALLMAISVSPAFSQTSTPADFEDFCQVVVGRWIGDQTWIADLPGFGNRGDKVTAYWDGQLAADGKAIVFEFCGGQGIKIGTRFYDPGTKQIRQVGVTSSGSAFQGVFYREDGVWKYNGTATEADGKKVESNMRLMVSDGGETHRWRGTVKIDGKETDQPKSVWRRVSKP